MLSSKLVSNGTTATHCALLAIQHATVLRALTIFADQKVAERSLLIKNMLEDLGETAASETIPIPNVSYSAPSEQSQYCPGSTDV